MDKLGEVEQMIAQRIATSDYLCTYDYSFFPFIIHFFSAKKTQRDTFWKQHAVSFIKSEDGPSQTAQAKKDSK